MPAIGFDAESSHDCLRRAKGAYFHDHTTADSALAVEQGQIEFERVDRALGIILDDERQSAVILLHGFRRVKLNMGNRVGSGNGCNTNQQQCEQRNAYLPNWVTEARY